MVPFIKVKLMSNGSSSTCVLQPRVCCRRGLFFWGLRKSFLMSSPDRQSTGIQWLDEHCLFWRIRNSEVWALNFREVRVLALRFYRFKKKLTLEHFIVLFSTLHVSDFHLHLLSKFCSSENKRDSSQQSPCVIPQIRSCEALRRNS